MVSRSGLEDYIYAKVVRPRCERLGVSFYADMSRGTVDSSAFFTILVPEL